MRFVKKTGPNMRVVAATLSEEEEIESKTVMADVEEARNPALVLGGGRASKL